MICWFKKDIQRNVFCCLPSWEENKNFLSSCFASCPHVFYILFIPQAGVKGKLGRLLGVFEVSILRKLAEQSAPMKGETALKGFFISQLLVSASA